MARILFTVPPFAGHLYPALSVASLLAEQGHEVAWAVDLREIGGELPPGARVFALDADAPVNVEPASAVRGLESLRLFVEDYLLPMTARVLPALVAAVRSFRPDVLAVDHQMPAGALAARRLGLPWVSLVTTPASTLKLTAPIQAWADARYRALQQPWLEPAQVRAWPDLSPHRVIVFSIASLAGPDAERVPAPYAFVGPVPAAGRRAIDFPWHWLEPGRRHLLVTLGTVSRDRDPRFFVAMMQALKALPHVQAVLIAPPALATEAPPNVWIAGRVPQPELLPRLDGVVCHAGHNTVCEALACGLPLVVSPIRDDQPMVARQVVEAGAALFLRHGKVTPESARDAIERLLATPSLRVQAQKLGAEIAAAPGRAAAAALIVEAAA